MQILTLKVPNSVNKLGYCVSDTVRTIDSDYVYWLKLDLQFYKC